MKFRSFIAFISIPVVLSLIFVAGAATPIHLANTAIKVSPSTTSTAEQRLALWAYVGPRSYLSRASVVVSNAQGKQVAMGKTTDGGTLFLSVAGKASVTEPYIVTTSGGKVEGKAFLGHLIAYVASLGSGQVTNLDLVSTTAASLSKGKPSSYPENIQRVRAALGVDKYDAPDILRLRNRAVGSKKLATRIRAAGGFSQYVALLASYARNGKVVKGLSSPLQIKQVQPVSSATQSTSSSTEAAAANAPCSAQTSLTQTSGELSTWKSAEDFAILAGANMIQVWSGGYLDTVIVGALTGFGLTSVNDQPTDQSLQYLANIENQLGCISEQIADVQASVDQVLLDIGAQSMKENCTVPISDDWVLYSAILSQASTYPLDANNKDLAALFKQGGTVNTMMNRCGSLINSTLFNSSGEADAAWYQLVKNNYSKYPSGFTPDVVLQMQYFLNYYATLEYQQAVLTSEYYNYQELFADNGTPITATTFMTGENLQCAYTDPGAYQVKANATDYCQWQMNIATVWPGNTYSDEVALCQTCGGNTPVVSGLAVSAVPGGLGASQTSPTSNKLFLNPQFLAVSCRDGSGCNYALPGSYPTNTLASFNAYASAKLNPQGLAPNNETWFNPLAFKDQVISGADASSLAQFHSFFSSWLNADQTTGKPVDNGQDWQLLTSSSSLMSQAASTEKTICVTQPETHVTTCQNTYNSTWKDTVQNGLWNSAPWNNNGTIATIAPSSCNGPIKQCNPSSFPTTPPAAYLLARQWKAGTSWPAPPIVTTASLPAGSSSVIYSAVLGASGCAPCTWVATPSGDSTTALPPGLTLNSATGQIAGIPTAPGTYSFYVTAEGSNALSFAKSLSITIAPAPVPANLVKLVFDFEIEPSGFRNPGSGFRRRCILIDNYVYLNLLPPSMRLPAGA